MKIKTDQGILDTEELPSTYEPFFCSKCGYRLGWLHEEAAPFMGLCDGCAAVVSQDNDEDPLG